MNKKTLKIVKLTTGIILLSIGLIFIFILISLLGDVIKEDNYIAALVSMCFLTAVPIGGGIILLKI